MKVVFNKPSLLGAELTYIQDAVTRGHISGDGHYSKRCHEWFERYFRSPRALLTTSCTHALEMAALLLDLQPGDEVIMPSFTFVSTANAFVLRGAKIVFVDIRRDTLNLDETLLERNITPRTRAIVPVHYAGVGCEMDTIMAIADRHGLAVIEDNAHGLFGKYKGKLLGTFGRLSTLSFHETKNVTCGEGGALILNDPSLVSRAEILREKGTDRSRFFRGEVDKYSWVDLGSSYLPSDILAGFLLAQLEQHEVIQARRRDLWNHYATSLARWAQSQGFRLPIVPDHCEQAFHNFYLIAPTPQDRDELLAFLKPKGVHAVFHYVPLHQSRMGARAGRTEGCPVAEDLSARLVRLPFYSHVTAAERDTVVAAVTSFEARGRRRSVA